MNTLLGLPPKKYALAGVKAAIVAVRGWGMLEPCGKNVVKGPVMFGCIGVLLPAKLYIFTLLVVADCRNHR